MSSFNKKAAETVTIDWKPNKNLDVPLYAQIVTYFTDNISTGNWTGGQNVPSQRQLAREFDVNRSTVVEAHCRTDLHGTSGNELWRGDKGNPGQLAAYDACGFLSLEKLC